MSAPASRLTELQVEVLGDFFRRQSDFYLTGGAALAGFHLGHRATHDLDLFTLCGPLSGGVEALRETARSLEAQCEETRTAPEFRVHRTRRLRRTPQQRIAPRRLPF